jgi:hypothetical protein
MRSRFSVQRPRVPRRFLPHILKGRRGKAHVVSCRVNLKFVTSRKFSIYFSVSALMVTMIFNDNPAPQEKARRAPLRLGRGQAALPYTAAWSVSRRASAPSRYLPTHAGDGFVR